MDKRITRLDIDEEKKKSIHKREERKLIYIPASVVVLWILANVCFAVFHPEDWFLGGVILAIINVIGPFLLVISKIAISRISGKYTSERVNESLFIKDSVIEYGYQNYADLSDADRVVVKIPIDYIESIFIDKDLIVITGSICQMYYENILTGETRAKEEYKDETFVLYDYFVPSLASVLEDEVNS